jgi:hypothetical protein
MPAAWDSTANSWDLLSWVLHGNRRLYRRSNSPRKARSKITGKIRLKLVKIANKEVSTSRAHRLFNVSSDRLQDQRQTAQQRDDEDNHECLLRCVIANRSPLDTGHLVVQDDGASSCLHCACPHLGWCAYLLHATRPVCASNRGPHHQVSLMGLRCMGPRIPFQHLARVHCNLHSRFGFTVLIRQEPNVSKNVCNRHEQLMTRLGSGIRAQIFGNVIVAHILRMPSFSHI